MDSLKLKDLLLELVEEMKIARITVAENEGRIQQLVEECHDKERKLEEEALKIQSLQDKHEETEIILSKASDDKLNQLEAEKTKLQLTVDSWEKEMKAIKEEVRTLQLSKYNLERTVREQQHRLQTQGQSKTSHSEQVADIENRCKQLQKEMVTYSDTLDILKKEVTEAGALNRMLASTNSHQKCQISSLKDELEKKQQEIVKLRVHVTPVPDTSSDKEINELKLEQLNKELKQVAQVNQDLKSQLEETRLTLQVTQGQLQESQDLAQRSMTSTKMLTERAAQQEAQITTLTKECVLLSEQSTTASAETVKLRQELDEWETKKNAEICTLEEEREKAKNECANLKKAALNLEDINASWATKNQTMMKDVEDLQMKLDSQAAELDKLKVTAVMFDKDTQTPLNTDSHPHASTSISRADQEECASNTQTMQTVDSETHDLHVKGQQATNQSVEEGKSLSQKEDIVLVPPCTTGTGSQAIRKDSQRNEKAAVKTADIDGENKEKPCTKRCKDNATDEDFPVKEIIVLEKISKGKGDGDTQNGENNIHHQLESISGKGPSDIPGHVSAGLCLNPEKDTPEKDTQLKGSQVRQNADNYDSTTTQAALTKTSPDTPDGNLEIQAAKVDSTEASGSEAVIDNLHLSSALVNSREVTKSLNKKETSLPMRDVESSLKMSIDEEHDSRGSTAKETRSSAVAPAVFGNHTKPDISDEDLVIPSTYVEENSSHCREKEYGEKEECEPVRRDCDGGVASLEAGEDGLPGSSKTRKEMGLSVTAGSQVSVTSNYTEATKELSGFHLGPEKIPGDNESVPPVNPKSMSSSQISEDPSTSRDLEDTCKENTSDGSVTSRADEAMIQRKDDHQDFRSSQPRSRSALKDEMERPLPAKSLPVLGDNSLMRKEKSSVTKASTFLQTPLRKHALSAHDATSSQYDPKPATLMPDVTAAFSYLSNTEPLPSDSNADVQKHSEAKTKFPSSPFLKKGSEIESATPFSSWKTLDQLRLKPQQQQSNPRTPVIFSHLTSSAQQLHQSLHQTTPSTTSTRISAFYPTSASLSDIAQQSTGVPKPFGVSQDTIPKTSLTQSKEIQGLMPRLTHGRSIIDRSSDRDGREKIASISKQGAESTQLGSPKYSPGTINLQNWLPPGMNMDHGGAGDAGGEVSLFSDDEGDEDMKDGVASQIDRIQAFLKKDRLKRLKLE